MAFYHAVASELKRVERNPAWPGCLVRADVIVLRTGERLHGTIAKRTELAAAPESFSQVALLVDAGDSDRPLHRFHALSIDFVILEDESGDTVVDFVGLYAHQPLPVLPGHLECRKKRKSHHHNRLANQPRTEAWLEHESI